MPGRLLVMVCVVLGCAGVRIAAAQSLADVARAEADRRKALATTSAKTYTNDDLRRDRDTPSPVDPKAGTPAPATPAASSAPATSAPASRAGNASPEPAPRDSRDEKYWRTRITAARQALERSQAFLAALQSQINGLWAEFTAMGDPYQRAAIEKKRFQAIAEQDRLKAEIAEQTKAIADIEDEARRAGVPAGWLR